ncbi:MAG: hypothetical protein ABIQ16_22190 [Polyangiaceae bacterium]
MAMRTLAFPLAFTRAPRSWRCLLGLVALPLLGAGCGSSPLPPNGKCTPDPAVNCDVSFSLVGAAPQPVGLVGMSCTGTARPDDNAKYVDDIPQGTVCADKGASADGKQTYCCSTNIDTCAYSPTVSCDSGPGFQCRGSNRPEALNPSIKCGNGVEQDEYINYCCSGQKQPAECVQVNTINCSERLTGFNCPNPALPKGEQLGASESRADYYRPLCPVPTPTVNPDRSNYCCYMPALPPPGASCVQDTAVPGCAAGRFGFACYGFDTPAEDFLPMDCPEKGFAGTSAEGYPATLFCCDFRNP